MIKKTILLLLTGFCIQSAKADTIDFWHVYYNNNLIKEFNESSRHSLVRIDNFIKDSDTLAVYFWDDTPCSDCKMSLFIKSWEGNTLKTINVIGETTPFKISLKELLASDEKSNEKAYEFILYENEKERHILFGLAITKP